MRISTVFILILSCLSAELCAQTIYLKDGQVIQNAQNLKEFESIFLYEQGGKSVSLPKDRVERVLDVKGKTIYELKVLGMRQIPSASKAISAFEFLVNNQVVAKGEWQAEGRFRLIEGRLPDGKFIENYPSGRIKREYECKGGNLNGICREYFGSGLLERESTVINGLEEGLSKNYHQNGKIKGESTFKNGVKQGITRLYFESGTLRSEMTFLGGVTDGVQKVYFETGELETEVEFRQGVRHGSIRQYYETGSTKMTGNFREGKLEGEVVIFYESGRVKSRQNFRDGRAIKN
jgi:antitoxin component YwqK of YwqJK toxin-antitoxin module